MQDVLLEVGASSTLVGVESLQVHAQLGACCSLLSQRSASALLEAPSGLRGVRQARVQVPRAGPHPVQNWTAPAAAAARYPACRRPRRFSTRNSDAVPARPAAEFRDLVLSESPVS